MKINVNDLEKIVEEAKSNNHDEVMILENGQVLSRKINDGYWEDISDNL